MAVGELRVAVRALLARPAFTTVAVATVALGIAANAAMFSVVDAVLLRPLPYPDPGRIVRVAGAERATGEADNLSPMDFFDVHSRMRTLERLAAFNNYADATLTGAGEPERIAGTRVTADFLSVLRVSPAIGRDFRPEDDEPDAPRVAILTHGFWLRRFAADPDIVGRTVELNSVKTAIIGVMAASFRHPFPENARQPDVLVPFRLDRRENLRSGHYLQAIGRLRSDATLADARADLAAIAADLEREYPKSNTGRSITLRPLLDAIVDQTRPALLLLFGAVAFVLLIACANLASLFLARSTSRLKELAVRRALGAGRWQVMRPIVAETLAVSAAGGACGLLLASWLVRALLTIGASRIPRADTVVVDWRVALFSLAAALLSALVFGAAPAFHAARTDASGALKDGGRSGMTTLHRGAHRALIVSEIALTLMLLVTAGLLMKSFWRLGRVDAGFRPEAVLTLRTSLPLARYAEGDEIPFYQRLESRVAAIAGVERVGAVQILAFTPDYSCDGFSVVGRDPFPPGEEPCAEHRSITPGYFDAMGIALVAGRPFDDRDVEGRAGAAIVSDAMARRFWPRGDAIGSRVVYQKVPRTIVGIVANVKHFGLDRVAPFELYTPHAQQPSYHTMTLVVRTHREASALMPSIRRQLAALDPDIPISDVRTMPELIATSTTEPRFRTTLAGVFAALALLLSAVGVAGVIAYAVGRRRQEIGVRVALGATTRQVTTMMLVEGLGPIVAGIAGGAAGAVALRRVVAALLFEVDAIDPAVFVGSAAVLLATGALATYLPARRAATIDPTIALRFE